MFFSSPKKLPHYFITTSNSVSNVYYAHNVMRQKSPFSTPSSGGPEARELLLRLLVQQQREKFLRERSSSCHSFSPPPLDHCNASFDPPRAFKAHRENVPRSRPLVAPTAGCTASKKAKQSSGAATFDKPERETDVQTGKQEAAPRAGWAVNADFSERTKQKFTEREGAF